MSFQSAIVVAWGKDNISLVLCKPRTLAPSVPTWYPHGHGPRAHGTSPGSVSGHLPGLRRSLSLPTIRPRYAPEAPAWVLALLDSAGAVWPGDQKAHWPGQGGAASCHRLPDCPPWGPGPGACGERRAGCSGRALVRQVCLYASGALRVGAAKEKYQLFIRKISGIRHARVFTFCPTAHPRVTPPRSPGGAGAITIRERDTGPCVLARGAREPHEEV